MRTLKDDEWRVLEDYLCSLSLNRNHHDLVKIELRRAVDVGDKHFPAGDYERAA